MTRTAQDRPEERVSFWNDPRTRSIAAQIFLALVLIAFYFAIFQNLVENLKLRNITSGWGFLNKNAGFDINTSLTGYTSNSSYFDALFAGFLNTLLVAALGIIFATLLGFIIGIMRLSKNWVVARVATAYVEILRNIPLLLQIFVWYGAVLKPLPGPREALSIFNVAYLSNRGFVFPHPTFGPGAWLALAGLALAIGLAIAIGRWARKRQEETGIHFPARWVGLSLIIGLPLILFAVAGWPVTFDYPVLGGFNFSGGSTVVPEFIALLLALSFYTATYIAEAVRAGIQAVSHGQTEAAGALGLRQGLITRLVTIPQAMRVIIPPLASQYLNLTKNSSLAVAIGYPDLVYTGGTVLNQTGQAVEIVFIWMVVYLSLSLVTSAFMNWFNAKMRLVER
ncbi:MAG TPA: amino acid ABC transporter permease [Aestuariivirga sp.]|nr:amino acid ABC transporter permease [Aestuariivirga sp.]